MESVQSLMSVHTSQNVTLNVPLLGCVTITVPIIGFRITVNLQ